MTTVTQQIYSFFQTSSTYVKDKWIQSTTSEKIIGGIALGLLGCYIWLAAFRSLHTYIQSQKRTPSEQKIQNAGLRTLKIEPNEVNKTPENNSGIILEAKPQISETLKTYTDAEGIEFKGDFKLVDGLIEGKGISTKTKIFHHTGSTAYVREVFEGTFKKGKLHGEGIKAININNGVEEFFAGQFEYGVCTYARKTFSNDISRYYEGPVKNDHFTGKCKAMDKGTYYEGDFVDDYLSGQGMKRTPDGTVYEGNFFEDKLNGQGKITFRDGTTYEGNFIMDILSGQGKKTLPNGTIEQGIFHDNKLDTLT